MKKWHSPQSRYFNDLLRAFKNALAMVGFMAVVVIGMGWFSK